MPALTNTKLNDDEIYFYFETDSVIDVVDFARFLTAFAERARDANNFGPDAKVALRRLESGSPTATWIAILGKAVQAVKIAEFAAKVWRVFSTDNKSKLAKAMATMLLDGNVANLTMDVNEADGSGIRRVSMSRSALPAVQALEAQRQRDSLLEQDNQLGVPARPVRDEMPRIVEATGYSGTPTLPSDPGMQRELLESAAVVKVPRDQTPIGEGLRTVSYLGEFEYHDDMPVFRRDDGAHLPVQGVDRRIRLPETYRLLVTGKVNRHRTSFWPATLYKIDRD